MCTDPNERKALFMLALLLGGERAFAFRAIRPVAPHGHGPPRPSRRRCEEGGRWAGGARSRGRTAPSMSMAGRDPRRDRAPASELELRREFEEIDSSGTGAISKADVGKRLSFVPASMIDTFFSMADTNGDGSIDFEEYKAVKREMSVSPRVRLFEILNLPTVEIANALAIVLCSFLVAVSTIQSLPEIPIPPYDFVKDLLRDGLHLMLTRDGTGVEAIVLINATLSWFNYVFAIDFFVRWWCADEFRPRYLLEPLSVLDIVVVLIPLSVQRAFPFLTVYNSPGLQNLLLLRILRLRRVMSDVGTFSRFEMALGLREGDVRPYQLQLARVLLSVFTLLSVSSGLIYATEHGVNPAIPDYFAALYFGLTTLTTVGFGDIVPVTAGGRLVVGCSILLGVAVIPAQAASLVDAILAYQTEENAKRSAAEAEASRGAHASADAAKDDSSLGQRRPTQGVGSVGMQLVGLDDVTAKAPDSQIIENRGNNMSGLDQSQVKQTLRFSYDDLKKVPKVLSDVKGEPSHRSIRSIRCMFVHSTPPLHSPRSPTRPEEIRARCPEIIDDGSRTFAAAMTSFEADHIEAQVHCHFRIPPGGGECMLNKEQVLLAIVCAMEKNGVAFAVPVGSSSRRGETDTMHSRETPDGRCLPRD